MMPLVMRSTSCSRRERTPKADLNKHYPGHDRGQCMFASPSTHSSIVQTSRLQLVTTLTVMSSEVEKSLPEMPSWLRCLDFARHDENRSPRQRKGSGEPFGTALWRANRHCPCTGSGCARCALAALRAGILRCTQDDGEVVAQFTRSSWRPQSMSPDRPLG